MIVEGSPTSHWQLGPAISAKGRAYAVVRADGRPGTIWAGRGATFWWSAMLVRIRPPRVGGHVVIRCDGGQGGMPKGLVTVIGGAR